MWKTAVNTIGVLGATSALVVLAAVPALANDHTNDHTIWVEPGSGTISAAVAKASSGDTLRLRDGVYKDSVSVDKPLTIQGSGWGTELVPPDVRPEDNACNNFVEKMIPLPGAEEGICALGGVGDSGAPDTSKRVEDVRISRLYVHGFNDVGVLGFNTDGFKVSKVKSNDNGGYGIARFVSVNSTFEDNSTSNNTEAGLYMGDSPNANSVVRDNSTDHNGYGIFFRDSSFQTAEGNKVSGNCVGVLALNTGSGGTPAADVGNYTITDNTIKDNNKECPASDEGPALSGIGVGLIGVKQTRVDDNTIVGQDPGSNATTVSGGIVVAQLPGGTAPSHNKIFDNTMKNNHPADVVTDGTDTMLMLRDNDCRSLPNHHCIQP